MESVLLSDSKPQPLHCNIGTDTLQSSLGPGNALSGYLEEGPTPEVAPVLSVGGGQEMGLSLLSPIFPGCGRGPKESLPFGPLIVLGQGPKPVGLQSFRLTGPKTEGRAQSAP